MRAIVLLVTASACSFSPPGYDGTRYLCPDGQCPDGHACLGGVCEDLRDAGPNLVVNPTLDEHVVYWDSYLGDVDHVTADTHGGLGAGRACKKPTGAPSLFTAYTDIAEAPPAIPLGRRYSTLVWVRSAPGVVMPPSLILKLRMSGGAVPAAEASGTRVTLSDSWQLVTAVATVDQADRTRITTTLWVDAGADGFCFLYDDAWGGILP